MLSSRTNSTIQVPAIIEVCPEGNSSVLQPEEYVLSLVNVSEAVWGQLDEKAKSAIQGLTSFWMDGINSFICSMQLSAFSYLQIGLVFQIAHIFTENVNHEINKIIQANFEQNAENGFLAGKSESLSLPCPKKKPSSTSYQQHSIFAQIHIQSCVSSKNPLEKRLGF